MSPVSLTRPQVRPTPLGAYMPAMSWSIPAIAMGVRLV